MSQKNFTSHGYPIPGAPYRPDQQPRNVARCGGPGLCPDCSREAGLGNRKNRMTTIDHQHPKVVFEPVGDETPLTIDAYQEQAKATAVYPYEKADQYLIAGLAGEVGEVASLFAKYWRGDGDFNRDHVAAELGDVLWFVAMLADDICCNLSDVAQGNLNKLADRANRGKLKGNGDNR